MRLRTVTAGALAIAVLATAAIAHAAVGPPAANHGVYVAKCNKVTRAAAFVGTMREIKASDHMWMRFTLFERLLPGTEYQQVDAPGLADWRKSRPGVKQFSYRQRVRALAEAAHYKVGVEFRWFDAEGELLRKSFSRSKRCRQPGKLPNLVVRSIVYRPARGFYAVQVNNTGRDVASGASVQLFVDGKESGAAVVLPDIPAGRSRVVQIDGVACSGFIQAVADPGLVVRESVEDDNTLVDSCADLRSR